MILLLLLLVVVEAQFKKKPAKPGELGMMIRMKIWMRRILDDKNKDWDEHEDEDD